MRSAYTLVGVLAAATASKALDVCVHDFSAQQFKGKYTLGPIKSKIDGSFTTDSLHANLRALGGTIEIRLKHTFVPDSTLTHIDSAHTALRFSEGAIKGTLTAYTNNTAIELPIEGTYRKDSIYTTGTYNNRSFEAAGSMKIPWWLKKAF